MAVHANTAEKLKSDELLQKPDLPQQENTTVVHISIGTFLKRARLNQKLLIDYIANELHIRSDYLTAIEDNTRQDLPEPVYVMGYIRSYAAFLGLDPNEAIRLYKLEENPTPSEMNLFFPKAVERKSLPKGNILIASAILLIALVTGWMVLQRDPDAVAPAAQDTQAALSDTDNVSLVEPTIVLPETITLKATDKVWIEIRDKNEKVLVSKTLKKEESYTVPDQKNLVLHTGNAAGLQIHVGDKLAPSLGAKGETKRNISLDAKKLIQEAPSS